MMSSAVLVQTKGWRRSFQPATKARILAFRSRTEPKLPRRIAWRSMIPNQTSINRPWVVLSSGSAGWFAVSEPVEVTGEVGDDAGVSGDFGVTAARLGVLA